VKVYLALKHKIITAKNIGIKRSFYIIALKYLKLAPLIDFILYQIYFPKYQQLLKKLKNNEFIIYLPFMSWNIPMFQRPQHFAMKLAHKGYIFIYCTDNIYDKRKGVVELQPNLYILDSIFYQKLMNLNLKKILMLHPNHGNLYDTTLLNKCLSNGDLIIYDYLDDLGEEVFGKITDYHKNLHQQILADERIICLASADVLYKKALEFRNKALYFVPNAVELQHFKTCSDNKPIDCFNPDQKIIGYFGAIAKWVDFKLIIKIAQSYPDIQIVLIGQKYDNEVAQYNLHKYKNIIFTGVINYQSLPYYAKHFDISIIPFLLNDTTQATSPIKLFEYMALGKPIITTDLPECRKYRSALVAKSHEEFIELISKALKFSPNDKYFNILEEEAKQNSWDARAEMICKAISKHQLQVNNTI
jgi:teichuronic acid biosynthesis glycosyltransferase TuaH